MIMIGSLANYLSCIRPNVAPMSRESHANNQEGMELLLLIYLLSFAVTECEH